MSNESKRGAVPSWITPDAMPFRGQVVDQSVLINWLERELPDAADQREYAQERCIVAITEAIGEAIEAANLSRADVAERLNRSKGFISQLLNTNRNMTLRTLADLLWACGLEVRDLELAPLGVMRVPLDDVPEWECVDSDDDGQPSLANGNLALAA